MKPSGKFEAADVTPFISSSLLTAITIFFESRTAGDGHRQTGKWYRMNRRIVALPNGRGPSHRPKCSTALRCWRTVLVA